MQLPPKSQSWQWRSRVSDIITPFPTFTPISATATTTTAQHWQHSPWKGTGTTAISAAAYAFDDSEPQRGQEMWPPSMDGDVPLNLADSFPLGRIPASLLLDASTTDAEAATTAASSSSSLSSSSSSAAARRCLWLGLLIMGTRCIRAQEMIATMLIHAYVGVLTWVSQHWKRRDNVTPLCPCLPAQGHVPVMVRNPLGLWLGAAGAADGGRAFSSLSHSYRSWMRLGMRLGLVLPIGMCVCDHVLSWFNGAVSSFLIPSHSTALLLRPVFVLCCQTIAEHLSRRWMQYPYPRPQQQQPHFDDDKMGQGILVKTTTRRRIRILPLISVPVPLPVQLLVTVLYTALHLVYWVHTYRALLLPLYQMQQTAEANPFLHRIGQRVVWSTTPPLERISMLVQMLGPMCVAGVNVLYGTVHLFGYVLPVASIQYMRAYFYAVEAEQVRFHQSPPTITANDIFITATPTTTVNRTGPDDSRFTIHRWRELPVDR